MDITSFFQNFLVIIVSGFSYFFNLLDSVRFLDISLLDFNIALLILSAVIPLVITLVKSSVNRNFKDKSSSKKKGVNDD